MEIDKLRNEYYQLMGRTQPFGNEYHEEVFNWIILKINEKTCNCKKSSQWERKNNPYHDWINYNNVRPPVGIEVLAQSDKWISEDYNKHGIRVGFQNENDDGEFVSAKWDNCGDTYENCEEYKPTKWKFFL